MFGRSHIAYHVDAHAQMAAQGILDVNINLHLLCTHPQ